MKNLFKEILKVLLKQFLVLSILLGTTVVLAVSWPTSTPIGETIGGLFINYFSNISNSCPDGQAIYGFDDDLNIKCVKFELPFTCGIDEYLVSGSCVGVGIGNYSPSGDNDIYECTTKPENNSSYISSGGGIDNCSFTCDDGWTGDICNEELGTTYPGCDTPDITIGTYTIAACNLGSTISGLGNQSYGYNYQFGRNSSYEEGTWTNGSSSYSYDWKQPGGTNAGSANNWGISEFEKNTATYINQNTTDQIKMQGPCAEGYHVPTQAEWAGIISAGGWSGDDGSSMQLALKLPFADNRLRLNGNIIDRGDSSGYYWSSSPNGAGGYVLYIELTSIASINYNFRANGFSVRCFKN